MLVWMVVLITLATFEDLKVCCLEVEYENYELLHDETDENGRVFIDTSKMQNLEPEDPRNEIWEGM